MAAGPRTVTAGLLLLLSLTGSLTGNHRARRGRADHKTITVIPNIKLPWGAEVPLGTNSENIGKVPREVRRTGFGNQFLPSLLIAPRTRVLSAGSQPVLHRVKQGTREHSGLSWRDGDRLAPR